MKRLFPAIALMFVLALSSFTVISSSNNTKDEKKKAAFSSFFKYNYTTSTWQNAASGDEDDTDICPTGSVKTCVIEVISGTNFTAAQSYALGLTSTDFASGPVNVTDYDAGTGGNQSMVVYPRN